ncbi:CBS domain-containing protein [Methanothermobacter tenebrarum]|uniref:Inosine-5-monophosphate dehydrogenase n=1 Tax=Methanothermobacter tenebrarum TaxID=680118 RepID=A0A328PAD5_9EURY|nr:CBS domain-containing protein [Methanothermobacter tenebrarum]MBC7101425.1 CBS domain-containing protein [Methanobacteriales archaeon]MBC7118384.1 CBS domain-containing protein [Methanobacteriaceae archaeon]NPV65236.1 CBS domain-containing protein [Methanobacteriaceae archaeon]RAO79597.1 inosine-5-monophosphate dehydrogenase [Methanothermobacter tenebrarum]
MKVEDVMTTTVKVMPDTQQVSYARNLMLKHGISHIVVVDSERKPVGIVTEKDITRKLRVAGPTWRRRPIDKISIKRVMSKDLISVPATADIREAVDIMLRNNISSLPVVEDGKLVGIITKTDLLRVYNEKCKGRWKVSDLMTKNVITVTENHTIAHVTSLMEENRIGRIIVIKDGEPVGIITSENISFAQLEDPETGVPLEKIYFIGRASKKKKKVRLVSMLTAGDIMTEDLIKLEENADAAKAANIMLKEKISGIPIVDEKNQLKGIITKTDIIKGIQ